MLFDVKVFRRVPLLLALCGAGMASTAGADSLAGDIPATFSVSQGSAHYRVPLQLPPGLGDFSPELSIDYVATERDGALGLDSVLSGVSMITRCARSYSKDPYQRHVQLDSDDALCLDGVRLYQLESPTRYMPEDGREVTVLPSVKSCGLGPCGFKVRYPDGKTAYFGAFDSGEGVLMPSLGW